MARLDRAYTSLHRAYLHDFQLECQRLNIPEIFDPKTNRKIPLLDHHPVQFSIRRKKNKHSSNTFPDWVCEHSKWEEYVECALNERLEKEREKLYNLREFVKTHGILTPGALLGWSLVAVRAPYPRDPRDPRMCAKIDF